MNVYGVRLICYDNNNVHSMRLFRNSYDIPYNTIAQITNEINILFLIKMTINNSLLNRGIIAIKNNIEELDKRVYVLENIPPVSRR